MNAKRVLLADDEPSVRMMVRERLLKNGYQVIVAKDGVEALDLAICASPDLIILDIMMPKLNGTEVAERLHADSRTSQIPIVFLTCLITPTEAEERLYRSSGGEAILAKPIDSSRLLSVVKTLTQAEAA